MKQGLSVPSQSLLRPSVMAFSWNCVIIFLNFDMALEIHMKLCITRAEFSIKIFFALKIGKMDQKWSKNRVFWIYWKIWSLIFYYLLCICTNSIVKKIFVPEIWAKIFSANQIALQKSTISSEQINEIARFFACWYKYT